MRWLWRRTGGDRKAVADAKAELRAARERLEAARRQGDEVTKVAESLRQHRARNHFAPMIDRALRGTR